jgi:hypothetical protein
MAHPFYSDAAMTDGLTFVLTQRSRGGLFGWLDHPPALVDTTVDRSLRPEHIAARRFWQVGAKGVQVSWSHHGQVQILRLASGEEIAAWWYETRWSPDETN